MVLFEVKGTQLKSHTPKHLQCPHCNSKGSIQLVCFVRHVRFLGIPLFPIRKEVLNQCDHCGKRANHRQLPEIQTEEELLKYQTKIPLQYLSGLILFLVLSGVLIFLLSDRNSPSVKRILEPQQGDVYQVKTDDRMYTLWLVDSIGSDSIYLRRNLFIVNTLNYAPQIAADSNFNTLPFASTKTDLLQLKKKGKIVHVQRDSN
ncbi:MAG: hypothetical protein EP332_07740 [Bacteroidetes bacterium]|nr:MAG: hypothetical protein EP332_07740 [Bacteroidota bacterium]